MLRQSYIRMTPAAFGEPCDIADGIPVKTDQRIKKSAGIPWATEYPKSGILRRGCSVDCLRVLNPTPMRFNGQCKIYFTWLQGNLFL